jgi:hypothetical protein
MFAVSMSFVSRLGRTIRVNSERSSNPPTTVSIPDWRGVVFVGRIVPTLDWRGAEAVPRVIPTLDWRGDESVSRVIPLLDWRSPGSQSL